MDFFSYVSFYNSFFFFLSKNCNLYEENLSLETPQKHDIKTQVNNIEKTQVFLFAILATIFTIVCVWFFTHMYILSHTVWKCKKSITEKNLKCLSKFWNMILNIYSCHTQTRRPSIVIVRIAKLVLAPFFESNGPNLKSIACFPFRIHTRAPVYIWVYELLLMFVMFVLVLQPKLDLFLYIRYPTWIRSLGEKLWFLNI